MHQWVYIPIIEKPISWLISHNFAEMKMEKSTCFQATLLFLSQHSIATSFSPTVDYCNHIENVVVWDSFI